MNGRYGLYLCLILLFLHGVASGWCADLQQALRQVDADMRTAQDELTRQRGTQAEARRALSEQMRDLERQVNALSEDVKTRRAKEAHNQDEWNRMTENARRAHDEMASVFNMVREYRKASETHLSTAELAFYEGPFSGLDGLLKRSGDPLVLYDTVKEALHLAGEISRNKQAGMRFPGRCVDEDGVVLEGVVGVIADCAFFAGEQNAGLCVPRRDRLLPGLFTAGLSGRDRESIRALIDGRMAEVPVDTAGGRALLWTEQQRTLWQHIKAGGLVMVPIVLTGLAALYMSILKGFQLVAISRETGSFRQEDALKVLRSGEPELQRRYFESIPERIGYLITPLIEYRRESHEKIEEIMHDRILAEMPALEKYLGTLAVLGGVAPLLGLLGTVTGIIHVFKMVTVFGSGDASILSGGISEALITTEFGLMIAIPVLLIHAWLARRVRLILGTWERMVVGLIQEMEHE